MLPPLCALSTRQSYRAPTSRDNTEFSPTSSTSSTSTGPKVELWFFGFQTVNLNFSQLQWLLNKFQDCFCTTLNVFYVRVKRYDANFSLNVLQVFKFKHAYFNQKLAPLYLTAFQSVTQSNNVNVIIHSCQIHVWLLQHWTQPGFLGLWICWCSSCWRTQPWLGVSSSHNCKCLLNIFLKKEIILKDKSLFLFWRVELKFFTS